jgi:hypothetical protein
MTNPINRYLLFILFEIINICTLFQRKNKTNDKPNNKTNDKPNNKTNDKTNNKTNDKTNDKREGS